ncbi:MAG TPA: ABC transporter, partial [Myxococcota bacterium]|nr:ABC transporter [Myxococcota bacterium]
MRALLQRGAVTLATLAGASLLLHGLLLLAPGDPIDLIPDGEANRAALAHEFGLDRPPLERLVWGAARGLT